MDELHYDEFGNYVGPELSDSEEVRKHTCTQKQTLSLFLVPSTLF
jgi:hypothetical protein